MCFRIREILFLVSFLVFNFASAKENYSDLNDLLKNSSSYSYSKNIQRFDQAIKKNQSHQFQLAKIYMQKASYLYNKKNYHLALESYILTNKLAVNQKDELLNYYSLYGIALTKQQLEEYDEAKLLLEKCAHYFLNNLDVGDNQEGLVNAYSRLSSIHLLQHNLAESEKYNQLEFKYATYDLDSVYAKKNKALILFHKGEYHESIPLLIKIKEKILSNDDFSWAMIIDQYLGENYLKLGNKEKSKFYYTQVIEQFKKHKIVTNELRLSFERLIDFAKEAQNKEEELEAINNLLLYDAEFFKTNQFLAKAYFEHYKQDQLIAEKKSIENEKYAIILICLLIILIVMILAFINYKKAQNNKKKLLDYIQQLTHPDVDNHVITNSTPCKNSLPPVLVLEIENILSTFEENKEYLNKEITLLTFSTTHQINKNYLSAYINSTKHKNFKQYVNELRINYIIKRLMNEHDLRNLTIEALTEEAGFKYRTTFSDAFLQHTGFRPSYFIQSFKKININSSSH